MKYSLRRDCLLALALASMPVVMLGSSVFHHLRAEAV